MANKEIETVPFSKDYFYLQIRSNGMNLREFMRKYGEYVDRSEKTMRRYLEAGKAPQAVVQRIADLLNVDTWYLTGRADCSNAVIFLKEYQRMCNNHPADAQLRCDRCPMMRLKNKYKSSCVSVLCQHPEEAVVIVQKWSDTHPVKTCGLTAKCLIVDEQKHNEEV